MTPSVSIGRCIVCRRSALLDRASCAECLRRFGARFAGLAARIRRDDGFRLLCRRTLSAGLWGAFDTYFPAPALRLAALSERALRRIAGPRSIIQCTELVELGAVEVTAVTARRVSGVVCAPGQQTAHVELSLLDATRLTPACTCRTLTCVADDLRGR